MKEITLEYIFPLTIPFIFRRFSTLSGLSEWFADDVYSENDKIIFVWDNTEHPAKMEIINNKTVIIKWLENNFKTQFDFSRNPVSKTTSVIITENFDDSEDESEITMLWDNLIKKLKRNLGLNN